MEQGRSESYRWVYSCSDDYPLREDHEVALHVNTVSQRRDERNANVHGFIEQSVLFALTNFSFTEMQSIDVMHNVSGVFKLLTKQMKDPKSKAHIGAYNWRLLDRLILSQKIPDIMHRNVRSIETHGAYLKVRKILLFNNFRHWKLCSTSYTLGHCMRLY
jgi:hypothetical protein